VDNPNSQAKIESAMQSYPAGNSLCIPSVDSAPRINGDGFAEVNPRRRPKTILLVEDEEFVRRLTGEVLQSAGYVLVIAASAADALKICRKYSEAVDLLLADVVMPGLSGRELAAEFRNLYPSGEVLLMSGYPEQLALCSLSAGKQKYLAKPFSVDLLLQRVREMLGV
jgi:CheY-like chemotaxis protein